MNYAPPSEHEFHSSADGSLEFQVKQFAIGLGKRGFWVSPENDWHLWRVHADGAAEVLGLSVKTLANARADEHSPHYRLQYQRCRNGVTYRIADIVRHQLYVLEYESSRSSSRCGCELSSPK